MVGKWDKFWNLGSDLAGDGFAFFVLKNSSVEMYLLFWGCNLRISWKGNKNFGEKTWLDNREDVNLEISGKVPY